MAKYIYILLNSNYHKIEENIKRVGNIKMANVSMIFVAK